LSRKSKSIDVIQPQSHANANADIKNLIQTAVQTEEIIISDTNPTIERMKTEHFIKSKSIKDKSPTYNANYTKLYMNSYAFVNKQNKLPKSFKNEEHIHKAMRKNKSKKLLILDLDETIIHSSYQKTEDNYDLVFYNVTILNKLIFIKN